MVGAVVLLGGIALGDTLRDSPGAEATTASGSPTLAAMPAGGVPLPDATIDPVWPHTSPVQV
ncbi:MAG: hypothetical protein JJE52_09880, partial [Acidimicrobiia bacterium]|nr:hypothetical protein [Acidimicrobiia bacterium]